MTTTPFGDPQTMALLGLAQGLLSAGSPSRMPVNLGGALAQGFGGALQNVQAANQYNIGQEQLKALQLANTINTGKAQFFSGDSGQGALNPNSPVVNPSANEVAGVQPALGGGGASGLPLVPGLDATQSRAAAYGWLAPGYVSAVSRANTGVPQRPGAPITNPVTGEIIAAPAPSPIPGKALVPDKSSPSGWRTVDVPGAVEGAAQYTGAQEGAKAQFQFEPYQTASGATIGVPKAIAAQGPDAIKQYVAQLQGGAPTMAPKSTAPASNDPWANIPKLEQPKGFGQTTYQKGRLQGAASLADELTKKTSDAAAISNERLVYNNQALDLLDKATTGQGALSIANVKNFLNSRLGVPLDIMDKAVTGDSNATTALNKDLINAATQKAKQAYGSRITQSEVMLQIRQASPNVDQMTATIRYLLQTDSAMSQYQIQKAQNLGKYLQSGGDPYQFEGWHSKAFPMSQSVSGIHLPKNEPQYSQEDLDHTAKIHGITVDEVKRRLNAR